MSYPENKMRNFKNNKTDTTFPLEASNGNGSNFIDQLAPTVDKNAS